MTRGKYAARAAKARAEAAGESLAEARARFEVERAEWSEERAHLLSELQRLSNRLVSDVGKLAEAEVRAAQEYAADLLREERRLFDEKAVKVLTLIYNHPEFGKYVSSLVFDGIAEILGVNGKEALVEYARRRGRALDGNRAKRRAIASVSSRKMATMTAEADTEYDLDQAKKRLTQSLFENRSRYVDPS